MLGPRHGTAAQELVLAPSVLGERGLASADTYVRVYTCMYCRYIHCINSLTHIYIYYNCSNYRLLVVSCFKSIFPIFSLAFLFGVFLLHVSEYIVSAALSALADAKSGSLFLVAKELHLF